MSKLDLKKAKYETRELTQLTNWENNPRSILKEDFDRLQELIKKLGIHDGLLINQDNIVLGGNMRLRAYHELNKIYNLDIIDVRVVTTENESEMLEYALSDNDAAGVYDDLKLAEQATLHPVETRLFKIQSNVLRPLENIINPPDPSIDPNTDQSGMDESLDGYLNGNIKQIVLYYDNEQYVSIVAWLEAIGKDLGLENNTDIITKLIKDYHEGITANP